MNYVLSILICISLPAWSQTRTTEGTGSTSMGNGGNINNSASRGQASQSSGKGANQMAGMAFGVMCMMGCNQISQYACYACPLAAMAIGQMGEDGGAEKQSGQVYDASLGGGGYSAAGTGYDTAYNPATGTTDNSGTSPTSIKDVSDALAAKGYKLNPDGSVTTPDGVLPKDTFNSAGNMAKAGFSSSAIQSAMAAIDKVNKDIDAQYGGDRVVAVGVNTSGDGFGGGGGGSETRGDSAFDEYLKRLRGGGGFSARRMLAGKSIRVGGEPMGVKGDDIFKMIERQYNSLNARNEFIRSK